MQTKQPDNAPAKDVSVSGIVFFTCCFAVTAHKFNQRLSHK
jgi:hypothetical protein